MDAFSFFSAQSIKSAFSRNDFGKKNEKKFELGMQNEGTKKIASRQKRKKKENEKTEKNSIYVAHSFVLVFIMSSLSPSLFHSPPDSGWAEHINRVTLCTAKEEKKRKKKRKKKKN